MKWEDIKEYIIKLGIKIYDDDSFSINGYHFSKHLIISYLVKLPGLEKNNQVNFILENYDEMMTVVKELTENKSFIKKLFK